MPDIKVNGGTIVITPTPGEPVKRFKAQGGGWTQDPESTFLYWVKPFIEKALGVQLIKKRMWKDGHLTGDDMQQYLRSKNVKDPECVGIYNGHYAVTGLHTDWNEDGRVVLTLIYLNR